MSKVFFSILTTVALLVLMTGAAAQAETWQTVGYWQFNEATSGIIPSTGDPILDSSGNGYVGNGSGSPTWGLGAAGDPDGAAVFSHYNSVLITHNPAFDLMLADLQSYRIEMDINATDWFNNSVILQYFHYDAAPLVEGSEGYRIMLKGANSTSDTTGRIQLMLWTNTQSGSLWQPESDPTLKSIPWNGGWQHIAIEIHPNANPALTYVQFEVDNIDAGKVYNTAGWVQSNIQIDPAGDHLAIGRHPTYPGSVGIKGSVDNVKFSILVPEPSTFALLGMGLLGLLCYAWRKRR